ncbi:MAG TPA: phage shock protein operon transcriptional activator [Sphingorhabdus sp.]|jgi:psp operon transcriptional activator|uniref:phage shock protein operon transcriptional activator n=1 Tax=Sphingorhabdus sp. TaxID=1902408 RepID=UPI002C6E6826|nr:phage shock protein operon transcriptional activator [Sphingorhabdus sp.]HMT41268.1 phage shock protein operon transcriptional activator [Sphingorhabdus sp.]HMU21051.1 phage shock protein operon transcriptional activator [Sphingorhabdus sp.]
MERGTQFIGQSSAFLDAVERASRAASLNRPILVIGERGTGKELIAERLHRLSQRWDGPLVTMNCAALPETLIEAELFGHEAGAFTGATRAREGRFEEAHGGTLFLDELGTLSMGAQERLLRAVEYGEVTRIGSSKPIRVDVRIVGATNESLPDMVAKERFRADLLDRLSFEVITLPPLRVREGDIEVLSDYFGRRMANELEWDSWPGFGPVARRAMENYSWPGNVRELRNVVERAVYRWNSPEQPVDYVQFDPFESPWTALPNSSPQPRESESGGGKEEDAGASRHSTDFSAISEAQIKVGDFKATTEAFEKALLEQALAQHRYNQRQTAKALNLSYDQLRHSLKKHDLLG